MKILIFGGKGWIGNQFINYLNSLENVDFIETNARADNENLIKDLILIYSPTHIISFIGRTNENIDLLENIRDNLFAPMVLSLLAEKNNIHFTYIGSGCIFDEDEPKSRKFLETDRPNFFGSPLSIIKGFTDRLIKMNSNTLNLRIKMTINSENDDRNYLIKMIKMDEIQSKYNSMTALPTIFPIIYDMMKKRILGTYNLTNPNSINRNEILEMYKEIIDNKFEYNDIITDNPKKICNNYLDTNKIELLYPEIPDIKNAVKECFVEMKKNIKNDFCV